MATTEPKLLTYDEWIKLYPEAIEEQEDCPECNGDGETECMHCGSTVDCEDCDGSGTINTAHKRYEEQYKRDLATWKKYHASLEAVAA